MTHKKLERLKAVSASRGCSLDDWFSWVMKQYFLSEDQSHVKSLWQELICYSEFCGKGSYGFTDEAFHVALRKVFPRVPEKTPLHDFCWRVLSSWDTKIKQLSPNSLYRSYLRMSFSTIAKSQF